MAKLNVKVIGEVIEWNGELYRKVERNVAVGDVVKAVTDWTDVDYGSYYEVISVNNGYFKFADNAGDVRKIGYGITEYFIPYEKIAKSAESSAPETYEQDGVTYRPTVACEKPTHFIRKPDAWIREKILPGKVYEITRFDGDGDYRCVGETGRDNVSTIVNSIGLVQTKSRRLVVGDYAKVVVTDGRGFPAGQIRKITNVDSSDIPYLAELLDGSGGNWFEAHELALASAEEVIAALSEIKKPKPARVPIGTYVKITNGDELPHGSIAKVTADDEDSSPYLCELLDGSVYEYLTADDFEVLSEADTKAAVEAEEKRKQAESVRQKWAAIGRAIGEYKAGDIVEVTHEIGILPVGAVGIIGEYESNGIFRVNAFDVSVGNWYGSDSVKLITPVEHRFDRKGNE